MVDLYQKHAGKQVHGDKFEAHFTAQSTEAGCSKDVPPEHEKEKLPPQFDDLFSTDDMLIDDTDDMLVDLPSDDMFGDMN